MQGEQTKQEKPTGALLAGAPRSQSHWGPLQSTWNAPLNYPLKNEGLGHLSPACLPRLPAYKLSGHPRDATCHVWHWWRLLHGKCCTGAVTLVSQQPAVTSQCSHHPLRTPLASRSGGCHSSCKEHFPGAWIPAVDPWEVPGLSELQCPPSPGGSVEVKWGPTLKAVYQLQLPCLGKGAWGSERAQCCLWMWLAVPCGRQPGLCLQEAADLG